MINGQTEDLDDGNEATDAFREEIERLTDIVAMQKELLVEARQVLAESELVAPYLWNVSFLAADLLNAEIDLSTGGEGDLGALREKRAALANAIVALRARMAAFEQRLEPDGQAVKPGEPGSRLRAALNLEPAKGEDGH
jgi:hypothetical protein